MKSLAIPLILFSVFGIAGCNKETIPLPSPDIQHIDNLMDKSGLNNKNRADRAEWQWKTLHPKKVDKNDLTEKKSFIEKRIASIGFAERNCDNPSSVREKPIRFDGNYAHFERVLRCGNTPMKTKGMTMEKVEGEWYYVRSEDIATHIDTKVGKLKADP